MNFSSSSFVPPYYIGPITSYNFIMGDIAVNERFTLQLTPQKLLLGWRSCSQVEALSSFWGCAIFVMKLVVFEAIWVTVMLGVVS
jgi:hypothetical protein